MKSGWPTRRKTKLALAQNLTKIIKTQSIYEKPRFHGVELRTITSGFVRRSPQGRNLVFLNRWLLEDAYSRELSKIPSPVVDIRPDMPPEFKAKLEKTIQAAWTQ